MANGHRYIQKIVKNGKTRYFYTMEELNAYKKALSSKDEMAALQKATGSKNASEAYFRGVSANHEKKESEERAKRALTDPSYTPKEIMDPNFDAKKVAKQKYKKYKAEAKEYGKQAKAYENYKSAKSLSGKAKAVSEVYKKYNPKTAKKIEKGKKQIAKLLNKKKKA